MAFLAFIILVDSIYFMILEGFAIEDLLILAKIKLRSNYHLC